METFLTLTLVSLCVSESFLKMPRFNAESAGNVQPGRVMIVLKESCVPDDVIRDIVDEQGEVKSMHRPANNQQLCFIQYADPE